MSTCACREVTYTVGNDSAGKDGCDPNFCESPDPLRDLSPGPGQNENASFVSSGDPHSTINISCSKPSCGANYTQWNVKVDRGIVDYDLARLEFDIHFSLVVWIRFEIDRNYWIAQFDVRNDAMIVPVTNKLHVHVLPVNEAFLGCPKDGSAKETTFRTCCFFKSIA